MRKEKIDNRESIGASMNTPYMQIISPNVYTDTSQTEHDEAIIVIDSSAGTGQATVDLKLSVWHNTTARENMLSTGATSVSGGQFQITISGSDFVTYFATPATFTSMAPIKILILQVFYYLRTVQPTVTGITWANWQLKDSDGSNIP